MRLGLPSRANPSNSETLNDNIVFVETYRESTEHHASDDDDLGEILVSPLTDGHGQCCVFLLTVYTLCADTSPPVYFMFLLSESFYITSVSGLQ